MTATWQILQGDATTRLQELDPASVQTCVTSPPYYGLRDYSAVGQLGLEPTPDQYVQALVNAFREVRRVLRDDGTVWLNLGDSYSGAANSGGPQVGRMTSGPDRHGASFKQSGLPIKRGEGIKSKDLLGIPWMVAFALRADGWYLRADIIWNKPNPMPESVTDRPTKSHEYVFLLSKQARYFYDAAAVREEDSGQDHEHRNVLDGQPSLEPSNGLRTTNGGLRTVDGRNGAGRNKRSVWTVATQPYPGAHFATFPPRLIEPCILAGAPEHATVLDPFAGAGTTGLVALRHNRSFLGIELNPTYADLARWRIRDDAPLLNGFSESPMPHNGSTEPGYVYPPRQIIVCAHEGDWIEWEHDREPDDGDCPFGECDCRPVLFQRVYERRGTEGNAS